MTTLTREQTRELIENVSCEGHGLQYDRDHFIEEETFSNSKELAVVKLNDKNIFVLKVVRLLTFTPNRK